MDFPAGPPGGKRPRGADELAPRRRGKRHEFDDVDDRMDDEEEEEEGPDPLVPRTGADTDTVVAAALRAEASAKAARQQQKDAEVKGKKAEKKKKVSFAKDDEEEGGACGADKVRRCNWAAQWPCFLTRDLTPARHLSHRRRRARRLQLVPCVGRAPKARTCSLVFGGVHLTLGAPVLLADIGDTEFDEDLAAVEERGAHVGVGAPGDDEGEFEPFNLDQERETGHFDDEGNYVFRKEEVRRRAMLSCDASFGWKMTDRGLP